jgi:hypothetical protein
MVNETLSDSDASLPEALIPLLADKILTCEYASIKRDGTPITAPLLPFMGEDGQTIDIFTGLAYPLKAERARHNPKVCLLYAEPSAALIENPPIILVYGQATVHDADLQANLDRFIRLNRARSESFARQPAFLLRWLSGYLARIWISVTPLKIVWWPEGDASRPAQQWRAPTGTHAAPSDPPPKPLSAAHKSVIAVPADWREDLDFALEHMGSPTLTVVDEEGYPVPFRMLAASRDDDGVRLVRPKHMPAVAKGRACLNFYKLQVKNDEMAANETVSFIGDVAEHEDDLLFRVERQLPNLSYRSGLRGALANISEMRKLAKRAEAEAARRVQTAPEVRL